MVRSSRDHDLDALTALAVAAQDGDRAGLAAHSRELQRPIYRLALRFCGHPIDAEDVALEVMLRLLTTLESYDGRSRFTLWVYANAVRQLLRSEPRPAEAGRQPSTPVALASLPREQRIAYILVDRLGFTLSEGAEICATEPAAFRERLVGARAGLRPAAPPGRDAAELDAAEVDAAEVDPELAVPASVWSRLVATMPTHLGDD